MNENQKNEIIDPNLDFIERAVEDTSVDFWLNSQK